MTAATMGIADYGSVVSETTSASTEQVSLSSAQPVAVRRESDIVPWMREVIERLPELIDELTATVEENGGTVYVAGDADDANRYVRKVAAEKEADRLVKSKSMTPRGDRGHGGPRTAAIADTDPDEQVRSVVAWAADRCA